MPSRQLWSETIDHRVMICDCDREELSVDDADAFGLVRPDVEVQVAAEGAVPSVDRNEVLKIGEILVLPVPKNKVEEAVVRTDPLLRIAVGLRRR